MTPASTRDAHASPNDAVTIVGVHHVRLPVSDIIRSRDWYASAFGFETRLTVEEEDRIAGVVAVHRSGVAIGLHAAPALAEALRGFCSVALSVGDRNDLTSWCEYLDALGVNHSGPTEGHVGWYVHVPDPDGLIIELHTNGNIAASGA
jgi:catechol 2,3-dioxygenase-like lactoylglutathione lyase family enzyme